MSILDALTGDAYSAARKQNLAAIGTGEQQAGNALLTSYGQGQNFLLGSNQGPGAFQYSTQGYDTGKTDAANQYGQTQGYLGQLGSLYQPMVQGGGDAYQAYLNATGANGAAGSQAATQAFQASPGYQYAMDQALNAVQRSAAARGGLAGGNATADILKTATGLADQGYQQYVNNLGNAAQSYNTGLSGTASGLGLQANASQNYGTQLGSYDVGQGAAQANILGQGAGLQQNLGNAFNGMIGNATNAITSANNTNAQGQTQASGNALGLGLGMLTGGLNYAGQNGGIGSALGKIFTF